MFNFILIALCCVGFLVFRRKSKPTKIYFEPMAAKSAIIDKYLAIGAMPSDTNKLQAYEQFQQECQQLHSQIDKQCGDK